MVLIIGGAYQGKLDYAKEEYGLTDSDVFTCEEGSTAVGFDEKIVDHFERYVLALIKAGQVPERAVGMQIRANRYKGRIIICDDISQGVVPMDKTERAWREGVGRTMVKVAQQADKVVRVFCGLPVVLKDETTGASDQNLAGDESAPAVDPAPKADGLEAVFAAEVNGAVKSGSETNSAVDPGASGEELKPDDVLHGVKGRGARGGSSHFEQARKAAQAVQEASEAQVSQAGDFGKQGPDMADMTPFKNFSFGNDENGLTPEEQFRKMFEKMKAERKEAKEKAAKEAAGKTKSEK